MSITRAVLRTRVKTRIRQDMATPTVNDLNDNSIDTWAQEKCAQVIHLLKDPVHFTDLVVPDATLTFANDGNDRSASFPSGYEKALALRVTGSTVTNKKARLLAKRLNVAETAGSDTHFSWEIGRAYTVFNKDLRKAIKNKTTKTQGSNSLALLHRSFSLFEKYVIRKLKFI